MKHAWKVLLAAFLITSISFLIGIFSDISGVDHRPQMISLVDSKHADSDLLITRSHSIARGSFHGLIAIVTGPMSVINDENCVYENNAHDISYFVGFMIGLLAFAGIIYFFYMMFTSGGGGGSDGDSNLALATTLNTLTTVNAITSMNNSMMS